MLVTIAIANGAPVGVVIGAFSKRLSRMYLWDTISDAIVGGQWLKAWATVEDVSPDGRYVTYCAEDYREQTGRYLAIARPPHFSALGFFPTSRNLSCHALFDPRGNLRIAGEHGTGRRVSPSCPLRITREEPIPEFVHDFAFDAIRGRDIRAEGEELIARTPGDKPVLIA